MASSSSKRRDGLLVAGALLALGVGLLVYWSERDLARSTLIPAVSALAGTVGFGIFGQWLPSFVHSLAFGLLTAVALPPGLALRATGCVAWALVNVAFEAGQHPRLAAAWHEAFGPGWLTAYFERGTFDPGDIAAALLGAPVAVGVLAATAATERNGDGHNT